jgi:hypothetical protein
MPKKIRPSATASQVRPLPSARPAIASLFADTPLMKRFGFLIRRLHQIHVALFLQEAKGLDITTIQFTALSVLHQHGEIDQSELAVHVGMDRTQRLGRRAPPSGTRVCLGACQSLARPKTPGYANPERRRVSESGRFVRVASAGTHGLRPGRAGSKGLWGAVTASGGGTERAGPFAASPEIAVPHCPHFQPARSRSWRGR